VSSRWVDSSPRHWRLGVRARIPGRLPVAVLAAALAGLVAGLVAAPKAGAERSDLPAVTAPAPASGVESRNHKISRTQDGAVASAVEYATLLARMFPLDAAQARSLAAEAASEAYRPSMVAAVDTELVPLQRQATRLPGSTTYRQSVLATRVDAFDEPAKPSATGDRAQVSVWTLLLVSQTGTSSEEDGKTNPIARFSTERLDLIWQRGAWRINGSSQTGGPTPLVDGAPHTADELDAALAGFADWRSL
jgi:hypothetical protein